VSEQHEGGRHLVLCFDGQADVTCYPEGAMDADCARRFAVLIKALHENPARILCALRLCESAEREAVHVH